MSNTSEYLAWLHIKDRCLNPKDKKYPYYGGRGIKVHLPWVDSFIAFINDVGKKPSKKHSLDRINNDGNYEPGNVRWATIDQQNNNRGNNKNNTSGYRGVTWDKSKQKWMAQVTVNYKHLHLGYFTDPEEASRAYETFKEERRSPHA